MGVADDEVVDVYDVIRRMGVWLVFNEFTDLLGAMSREGAGGIIINPARPLGMQRYTAAHELGHYVLHSDLDASWDTTTEVMGSPSIHEQEAQAFASAFLMPRKLINLTLGRLHAPSAPLDATTVYAASRDIEVSYEAMLVQLAQMKKITAEELLTLRKVKPATVKKRLGGTDSRATVKQVWTADAQRGITALTVNDGDEIAVTLPENPTTGYRWHSHPSGLDLVDDQFFLRDDAAVGEGGTRRLVYRAHDAGTVDQLVEERRPFAPDDSIANMHLRATVRMDPVQENALILAPPLSAS
ncbi:protease inhibitor I42 family protein [Microbacterium sp. WCS2018Hpa-9]|uniref:protease inhibitor I42 family protein n=1 Tax=Microbacterium sp. WCS2018Hpa-9 TaxID=3073635 RepID=UPI00288B8DFC|nr:protease inhibitor I42 family protein [Microbacterium sp. WCS2018Hpa-9]